ncbi:enoyl-CoA hydratase-related protein [Bradyrhizobium sp. BR13661]|uniref:enoyl-CoA hydratase-related protein n=1 Tax=Bradyrhizobium sp. BR13661 TaxID=2940622 RepID=UPI0024747827|nr:enoyl-CoA hydratase-related protein [Bradyrhizobium sp. BR13661]MDH6258505.1 enoyl-CoA hydratase/carnithine racemase [Bradyrhizobium sp. BR13661]
MIEHIIVTDSGAIRMITMRRPEKKNTLTQDMYLAMSDAINAAQSNPAIRCLILAGRSGVFTAGNDIGDFLKAATEAEDLARPRNSVTFLQSLVNNRKPIIAAVDGIAIGIGMTMVVHCDYVLASTTTTFSSPYIQYGLVPDGATSLLVPHMVGHQRAFAMLLMGREMSAEEAREAGLVNQIVAPGHVEVEALKVAREICALPADAVAVTRKLLKPPTEQIERRIALENHFFAERMRSPEAVAAFQKFLARKAKR